MKHYYRFNKDSERVRKHLELAPEILIFNRKFGNDIDYQYPSNYPYYWFYEKDLIKLSDEEVKNFIEEESKLSLEEILIRRVHKIHWDGKSPKGGGVNSFAIRGNEGLAQYSVDAPCYAQFITEGAVDAVIWDSYKLTEESKKSVYELYHWIMNDSPWLHCIHPSWDILSAQERTDRAINGPVRINLEAPANEVAGFAVALRCISEHAYTIPSYLKLREEGASKPMAFMLAAFINWNSVKKKFTYFANGGGHHFMTHCQEVENLCKFFKSGYFLKNRSTTPANKARYSYIANQITPSIQSKGTIGQTIEKHLKVVGEGWEVEYENIDVRAIFNELNEVWENV